ncbi:hypothetical protein RM50_04565 [Pseudarthrobacter phenanthrenivorans]|uniref:Uncharacterized protein n=2 Tax=Pseudarthrobacter phenanthrenivorans TaxID=361575 RepID=A0A0B4DWA5_PSEPS|nr:hypothetical protein RM50_04565 [Pseudarthrobacter phenanthrenivorans]
MGTGVGVSNKVAGGAAQIAVKLVVFILVPLAFVLVFGFIKDRPSRVAAIAAQVEVDNSKKLLTKAAAVLSAGFHLVLSFVLLTGQATPFIPLSLSVLIGFAHLPLAVMVAARRRSAYRGVPYPIKALTGNVSESFESLGRRAVPLVRPLLAFVAKIRRREVFNTEERDAKILQYAIPGTLMVLTALFGILSLFKLPVAGFASFTGGVTWVLWMVIAWRAAGRNIFAGEQEAATRADTIAILRHVYGGSASDWDYVSVLDDGSKIVATNTPFSVASLQPEEADARLAQIASGWEFGENDESGIVLRPASDKTLAHRKEIAQSRGLFGARIDTVTEKEESAQVPTVTFTAEDLFS